MKLLPYIAKRLLYSIFVLLGLSILIFTLSRVIPGDPARLALGPMAPQWAVDQLREKLHLNDPLPIQYIIWLTNALRGDLGESIVSKRPVIEDVITFFPASFELVIFSTIISIALSVLIGAMAGRRANSLFDNLVRVFSYIGISVPTFVWAILFLFFFGYIWKMLPTLGQLSTEFTRPPFITGMMSIDALIVGDLGAFIDHFKHMILPSVTMSISRIAQDAKILRAGMIENLKKDYITSATSFGVPESRITFKYLMKPSIIPMVSIMGMEISGSMGGSFIIETIFNWPGFGRYGMWAMLNKDLNAIIASVMIVGAFFALINIVVDIIIAYLDPRIRMVERSA
ncbi:ABC transporter permease [Candidatus Bathyarchaeota archaeon]|nr:ABC transporter permease [Candidatus Bathyarchaeota archaeon]